jgi:hypothetical protein
VVWFCQIAGALALVPQPQYSLAIIVPLTIIAVMITVVTMEVPVSVIHLTVSEDRHSERGVTIA